jgi:S1-C subfamily serine protease
VTIKVLRDGDEEQVKVRIAEMPKDLEALASSSDEARGKHALTGITVKPFPSGEKGVEVTEVKPGSAASRAGIREGDIIREINRQVVKDIEDFQSLTRKLDSDDRVLLLLQRGRTTIFCSNGVGPQSFFRLRPKFQSKIFWFLEGIWNFENSIVPSRAVTRTSP